MSESIGHRGSRSKACGLWNRPLSPPLSRTRERGGRSPLPGPRSATGFTLIELVVVVIVVVVLAGTFLVRVPYYQEQAEKAAVQQVEGALQSALVLRYGALMARGAATERELSILVTDNPITWLQQKPRNYAGEYYDPTPGAVGPGHWMFDLKSRELIYVVDRGSHFVPGKDGKKWIRFHTRFQYEPVLGGGAQAQGKKELVGALFEPTEPYRWLD